MTNDVEIGNLKSENEFQKTKMKCEKCQMMIACGEKCRKLMANIVKRYNVE